MESGQALKSVRSQRPEVTVVSQVELLQSREAHERRGLDVWDVVGVQPKHDCGGAEMALEQPLDLVVLKKDPLALGWDSLRNHLEVVSLAAHRAGGVVADAVMWTRLGQL